MSEPAKITREQAFRMRPTVARIVDRTSLPDGGVRIKVPYTPSAWQKMLLRIPGDALREFDLDAIGAEVLELCDGNKNVRYIINQFARQHQVDEHQAETAVTTFLRTMMRKGIITMVMPKGAD